ncbi:MAG: hypothetical protein ACR2IE_12870 [Candidatus Sumerlaeaceae bacterium]
MTLQQARIVIATMAFISAAHCAVCQSLLNGDFETNASPGGASSGWIVEKGTFVSDNQKHNGGLFSGKINGGERDSSVYQDVAVVPGSSYVLSGVWRNGDKTAPFDVARVALSWLNAPAGTVLQNGPDVNSGDVVSNWTPFRLGPVGAPAGAGSVRIRLSATFNTAAFDDLKWEMAPAVTPRVISTDVPSSGTVHAAASQTMIERPASATEASLVPQTEGSAIVWVKDVVAGYRAAAMHGRKVLLFLCGEQNAVTRYFDQDVFTDSAVQTIIATDYIPIRLDFNANADLAKRLHIAAPGTVVIYDASGTAREVIHDQVSVAAFEKSLRK